MATCITHPDDPDHEVPVEDCTCGVYAFWTVEELLDQYLDFARRIVAVIRMEGLTIEGDNGVKANAAQIVAWWCAGGRRRASHGVRGQRPRRTPVLRPRRDGPIYPPHNQQRGGTPMGDIGKPRRRVIRVPATPIRKPAQEPSRPAPKPAPEPVREPARTG